MRSGRPVVASHKRTEPSHDTEANRLPSAEIGHRIYFIDVAERERILPERLARFQIPPLKRTVVGDDAFAIGHNDHFLARALQHVKLFAVDHVPGNHSIRPWDEQRAAIGGHSQLQTREINDAAVSINKAIVFLSLVVRIFSAESAEDWPCEFPNLLGVKCDSAPFFHDPHRFHLSFGRQIRQAKASGWTTNAKRI